MKLQNTKESMPKNHIKGKRSLELGILELNPLSTACIFSDSENENDDSQSEISKQFTPKCEVVNDALIGPEKNYQFDSFVCEEKLNPRQKKLNFGNKAQDTQKQHQHYYPNNTLVKNVQKDKGSIVKALLNELHKYDNGLNSKQSISKKNSERNVNFGEDTSTKDAESNEGGLQSISMIMDKQEQNQKGTVKEKKTFSGWIECYQKEKNSDEKQRKSLQEIQFRKTSDTGCDDKECRKSKSSDDFDKSSENLEKFKIVVTKIVDSEQSNLSEVITETDNNYLSVFRKLKQEFGYDLVDELIKSAKSSHYSQISAPKSEISLSSSRSPKSENFEVYNTSNAEITQKSDIYQLFKSRWLEQNPNILKTNHQLDTMCDMAQGQFIN